MLHTAAYDKKPAVGMFLHQPRNKNQHVTCIRQREQLKLRCLYVTEDTTGNEKKTQKYRERTKRANVTDSAKCHL